MTSKTIYRSSEKTNAPLTGAIEARGLVFVSGQIHINDEMQLVGNTIAEKFDTAIKNVKKILSEAGLVLGDIVNVKLYLTDLTELKELNEVYGNYFEHPFPTRTAVEVGKLPLGADLEIDVIASRSK